MPRYPLLVTATRKFQPVLIAALVLLTLSFVTRLGLLLYSSGAADLSIGSIIRIFLTGFFYDCCTAAFVVIPLLLHICFTGDSIYHSPWSWVVTGLHVLLIVLIAVTNIIPKEFSGAIPKVIMAILAFRLLIFLLLWWRGPSFRNQWRKIILQADIFILIFLLSFNVVSEFFFWDEFSARYNFIAVDYLVYSNEVVGNIQESYPVYKIVGLVLLFSLLLWWPFRKRIATSVDIQMPARQKWLVTGGFLLFPSLVFFFINNSLKNFSENRYNNELAGNGIFEFATAFVNNKLDYYQFYNTLPDEEAFQLMRKELQTPHATFTSTDPFNLEREIRYTDSTRRYNIVLISVESLSASFMGSFGNKEHLTPQLDSLANKGVFFTKMYACGTRTVRGLEALSLSIPPLPGQSIVKQKDNENLFSLGSVLKSHAYKTRYIYGGYGYFDNMEYFFSHNGYEVTDRKALSKDEIHYANIWGVADEDLFTLTLKKLDEDHAKGQPFFAHVMTVSNHRPYTFPKGRIPNNPDDQSREGAVAYTDYAIGRFIREASSKPWFANTIFVIIADHCAKASGKTELPVEGYHIPMIIYAPAIVAPQRFDRLTSQLDVAPTILGLLKLNYRSKFYGRDVFDYPDGNERALISTYQGIGYLNNEKLLVQMPPKKIEQYQHDFGVMNTPEKNISDSLRKKAIAYYQTAAWLLRNKKYNNE